MTQLTPYQYHVIETFPVTDADTVNLRITLGFGISAAFRFRLAGIDAPEVYGADASPEGRDAAEFVTDWLAERDGELMVRTYKGAQSTVGLGDGSFGRWKCDVVGPQGESLADDLRAAGYGNP